MKREGKETNNHTCSTTLFSFEPMNRSEKETE
jgi:hypothetical protein